jgi:holo-[acyl-carrier protein] synthase
VIYGIGTDVCDIRRIRATLERKGERFAQKVLGPSEWQVFEYRKAKHAERGLAYLATRFSAKESFSKAIGLGMHMPMSWRACEILNAASGQPFIRLHGELAQWFGQQRLHAHITVSDETEYVATFCVVERLPEGSSPPTQFNAR